MTFRSNKDVEISTHFEPQPYPQKENRYWRIGWNTNYQYCYTDEDIALLEKIKSAYKHIEDEKTTETHFNLSPDKRWYELWVCMYPELKSIHRENDSFTLPSREAKDTKFYPLWNFADNMARQIANWQSERVKNQRTTLMNDPVMLAFDELRHWFFNVLAEKECKKEVLEEIAKRQSYLKNLIHLVPNFGPDRLRLHEIQHALEDATKILSTSLINKELPQLLSDVIVTGKNLETTLGTYLHFLLIDEEVSDNFSVDYLEGKKRNCQLSPVCKVYHALEKSNSQKLIDETASTYQNINPFYELQPITESSIGTELQLKLKEFSLDKIRFASFVKNDDKQKYLEAMAAIEAIIRVRKTLEKFNSMQAKLGTYVFAVNFYKSANELASHYINLIDKTKLMINDLVKTADYGLNKILANPDHKKTITQFEKNLRALETRVAKGTTVNAQLEAFCRNAIASMQKYQHEMKRLVLSVQSGEASKELEAGLRDLYQEMKNLNAILPALINNQNKVTIDEQEPFTQPQIAGDSKDANTENDLDLLITNDQFGEWGISYDEQQHPIFIFNIYNESKQLGRMEFHGSLSETKYDPTSNQPIYVYTYENDQQQSLGTAEFYGQPFFCVSPDKQQHNIIKTTGILSQFILGKEKLARESQICEALPPSIWQSMLHNAGSSALHGVFRGGSNVFSKRVSIFGLPKQLISQVCYIGCVFVLKFGTHYSSLTEEEKLNNSLNAVYKSAFLAAYETGQIAIINAALTGIGSLFDKLGTSLINNEWHKLGWGLKQCGSLFRYGFFAYNSLADVSDPSDLMRAAATTTASVVAGTAAEIATEVGGEYFLKK